MLVFCILALKMQNALFDSVNYDRIKEAPAEERFVEIERWSNRIKETSMAIEVAGQPLTKDGLLRHESVRKSYEARRIAALSGIGKADDLQPFAPQSILRYLINADTVLPKSSGYYVDQMRALHQSCNKLMASLQKQHSNEDLNEPAFQFTMSALALLESFQAVREALLRRDPASVIDVAIVVSNPRRTHEASYEVMAAKPFEHIVYSKWQKSGGKGPLVVSSDNFKVLGSGAKVRGQVRDNVWVLWCRRVLPSGRWIDGKSKEFTFTKDVLSPPIDVARPPDGNK